MKKLTSCNRSMLILNGILFFLYLLILADYIVSVYQAGFAETAGGVTIPDSTLTVPVLVFALATVLQTVCFCFLAKSVRSRPLHVAITGIKAVLVFVSLWMTNDYVFHAYYYAASDRADFHSPFYVTLLVSICLALMIASVLIELIRAILAGKRKEKDQ